MITIAYILVNRGRNSQNNIQYITKLLSKYENILIFVDESDSTEEHLGLDGRKVLIDITEKMKNTPITLVMSEMKTTGISILVKGDIKITKSSWIQINRNQLQKPQGRSEKYKHHRLISTFNTPLGTINIVVQHNSAFIRPITRAKQTLKAIDILNKLQNKDGESLCFLIRDQNTWIPGEGRVERYIRKQNKLICLTDSVERKYENQLVEGDSGGLNRLHYNIAKLGILDFIDRYVIPIGHKMESICTTEKTYLKIKDAYEPSHIKVPGNDHGILLTHINSAK